MASVRFFSQVPPHPTSSPSGTDGDRKFWVPPIKNLEKKNPGLYSRPMSFLCLSQAAQYLYFHKCAWLTKFIQNLTISCLNLYVTEPRPNFGFTTHIICCKVLWTIMHDCRNAVCQKIPCTEALLSRIEVCNRSLTASKELLLLHVPEKAGPEEWCALL